MEMLRIRPKTKTTAEGDATRVDRDRRKGSKSRPRRTSKERNRSKESRQVTREGSKRVDRDEERQQKLSSRKMQNREAVTSSPISVTTSNGAGHRNATPATNATSASSPNRPNRLPRGTNTNNVNIQNDDEAGTDVRGLMRRTMDEELHVLIPKNNNLLTARKHFRTLGMKPSHFKWHAVVGKGTFGNVKMVTLNQVTAESIYKAGCPALPPLAIKTMRKENILETDQVEHIRGEVGILSTIDHPFIIALFGVMHDPFKLYLLMEYINGGELFSLLANMNHFGYEQAQFYAAQVVLVFEYLHQRKIAYRDLKPENILIDSTGNIKMADFGFAKVIDQRSWTICGTPEYIAPEIIASKGHTLGVDWWSLGVLIYEMMTGYPPFAHPDVMYLYRMIQDVDFKFPKKIDIRAKDLIRRLLVKDLTRRYGCLKNGADDIKKHKFFRSTNWQDCIDRVIPAPWKPEMSENDPANKYFDAYDDSSTPPKPISAHAEKEYFAWFNGW